MARAALRSGLWYSRQLAEGGQVGRELAVCRDRRPAALRGRGVQADRLARARARLGRVCAAWKALLGGAQAACAACGSPSSSLGTQIATPSAPNACSSRTWSRRDACAARGASCPDSWPRTALQRASSSIQRSCNRRAKQPPERGLLAAQLERRGTGSLPSIPGVGLGHADSLQGPVLHSLWSLLRALAFEKVSASCADRPDHARDRHTTTLRAPGCGLRTSEAPCSREQGRQKRLQRESRCCEGRSGWAWFTA